MRKTRLAHPSLGLLLVASMFLPMPVRAGVGVNPTSLSFGSVTVNTSSSAASVVVTNNSGQTLSILQVLSSLPEFIVLSPAMPITLGAHGSASFQVMFQPDATLTFNGSIILNTSRKGGSSQTISVSGTGTPAAFSASQPQLGANPSSAIFGSVVMGNSNSQTINLTNSGTAAVSISQANVSGAGFSITGMPTLPMTINPGYGRTFNAVFAPTTTGGVTGSVSLLSNAPNSPLTIALSGTGVAVTNLLSANPTSLSFNNVNDASSSTLNVTLTNTGNSNVTISSVTVSGAGFSATGVAGTTLTPSQTATLGVTFAPTVAGAVSGSVSVVSNATNSPSIALSGTGVQLSSHAVGLTWTASTSTDVVGYNIYRGTTTGGPYSILDSAAVAADAYTDSTAQSGLTYFYVVRSVDGTGTESANSTEVSATIQ